MPKDFVEKRANDFIFYRNGYRKMIWLTIFLLIFCIATLIFAFYKKITEPVPSFFATTSDGRLIKIKGVYKNKK